MFLDEFAEFAEFDELLLCSRIDLLAILLKSLDRALFLYILHTRFDRVALELLSFLYIFENSTKCRKMSFDSD